MEVQLLIILSILFSVEAIEIKQLELSRSYKDILDAFDIIIIKANETYVSSDFTLITIGKSSKNETQEMMKLEIIKRGFKDIKIKIANGNIITQDQHEFSVFLINNVASFKKIENSIHPKKFFYSGFHLIIMLDGSLTEVHEIFKAFWSKNIYNVYALIHIDQTLLTTFQPFENEDKCGDISPRIISKFINGKFIKSFNLRKRFKNLKQCPISVTTFENRIAVFKEIQHNGTTVLRGYEISLIKTVAKLLNFTLELNIVENATKWGNVYENGSITGILDDLITNKTSIAIGSLFLQSERLKYFDSSRSYLNFPVLIILSQAEKLNPFEKLLLPFKSHVWILMLVTLCFGVLVITVINFKFKSLKSFVFGNRVKHPIMNIFAIVFGLPQIVLPKRNFARFILMMFILLTLVLRSLYQGSLYKFLQSSSRRKQPDTIRGLIDDRYTFLVYEEVLDFLRKYHPKIYQRTKVDKTYESLDLDILARINKKTAIFGSRVDLSVYSRNHSHFPYKICKEHLITANTVLYYNKNFFLKHEIDEVIQNTLEYGFMKHWISKYDQTAKWQLKSRKPRVLTLEHLSGAFWLLIIGFLIGLAVFVFEIFVVKF